MPPADGEVRLPGGNVGGAVRVGDTVRRRTGPWTTAVHGLLDYLAGTGLAAVPRVHGFDEAGREVLDYLPGEVIDVDTSTLSDTRLASTGRWLRSFHEAVATYCPGPQRWYFGMQSLQDGQIICHNDVAPYNMAFDADGLVGVFDWDLAGPGDPVDDLAFLAWNAVPLVRPVNELDDAAIARRLCLLADAYADPAVEASTLLDAALARMRTATDRIEAGQRAGDEGMLALGRVGEPARTRARIDEAMHRVAGIKAALIPRC
ncbi:MAG: phosphotransferase [Candidatus Nanopelagicales bacterium]